MILKGKKEKTTNLSGLIPVILLLALFALIAIKVGVFEKKGQQVSDTKLAVYCGAEKVAGKNFITNDNSFSGGETQSDKKARTGSYSSVLNKDHKYGITYKVKNPIPGKTYKAEVWSYAKGTAKRFLVVSGEGKDKHDFYQQTGKSLATDGDWWIKFELVFTLPVQNPVNSFKVYVYKDDSDELVYFDDFRLTEIDTIPGINNSPFNPKELKIQVDKKGVAQLDKIRKRAFSKGLLVQTPEDEITIRILNNEKATKAKLRYKGDWLDHLMSGSPSYRIKLASKNSWNGLQTFSVQHPKTRGYLREWVFHEFLKQADVLTPRYDFIYFKLNDKKKEIRALEEHFTKNLVEHQLRREGPIIKFVEDRFWEGMERSIKMRRHLADPENKEKAFWTSEIKPFKEKKTSNNSTLNKEFEIAQNLLYQYKFGLKKPSKVFDIDKLAKLLVIVDICSAYHSLTWHNQRFYYNPVTSLLEPIGFDGNGEKIYNKTSDPIKAESVYTQHPFSTEPLDRVFYDRIFIQKYISYLNQYVQPEFIKNFISQIAEPLQLREKFLQEVKKDYHFDKNRIFARANKIREGLMPFSNSLQIFKSPYGEDSVILKFYNAHTLPLEIVNINKKKSTSSKKIGTGTLIFPQKQDDVPEYTEMKVPSWVTHVFYKLPGIDSIFRKNIPTWSSPEDWTPRTELLNLATKGNKFYEETNGIITFAKKDYNINQPLIIPKGKKVIVEPGAVFNFSNGGFFLSFSPVSLLGDYEEPIIIEAKDDQSGSFTVMQSKGKSVFRYVIFKEQQTLGYKGWNLTGGVTLYESDCDLLGCKFINNHCEDALNIVRSEFTLEKCSFANIFSDAFDADFCKGTINDAYFVSIGNDALDFSTSVIDISGCKIDNVGDKGISVGEQATVKADNVTVKNANIAFASKDLSSLTLNNIIVNSCKKGFVAYQKKPEYGPAKIILKKHELIETDHHYMIEAGSTLEK